MAREIDWDSIYEGGFEEKRRKAGFMPFSEHIKKARVRDVELQKQEDLAKAMEPQLKAVLVQFCVQKVPILVKSAFGNPTETLGGLQKSVTEDQEEDDGFYYSGGGSSPDNPSFAQSFEEVMETIPAGAELLFKSYDKQLDKMIFSSQTGREVEIYTKPLVLFQGKQIKNPGYYGLLFNTNIREKL